MKVAFLHGTGIVDEAIQWWSHGDFCHCQVILNDGSSWGCSPWYPKSVQFMNFTYDSNWTFIEIPTTPEQDRILINFCQQEQGCGYDWAGIVFSQILPFGWQSKSRYFCSEAVLALLQQIGIGLELQPYRYDPVDTFKILIYRGFHIIA
jgi:hypothetical protein